MPVYTFDTFFILSFSLTPYVSLRIAMFQDAYTAHRHIWGVGQVQDLFIGLWHSTIIAQVTVKEYI